VIGGPARGPALPALEAIGVALPLAAGLAIFLIREGRIAGVHGFPLDDAWIHLHFARNIAEGAGFSYNPGTPVSGSTAPLWTLALAGVFWTAGAHPVWAKCLGAGCALAAALVTRSLVLEWTGARRTAALAGALVALSGPLLWGALSGMEVTLAALLVTGALLSHARTRPLAASVLLGLAILARPEASLLVPLVALAGPIGWRPIGGLLGALALLVGPWVAFNLATVGGPLPATAVAKVGGGLVALLRGAREPLSMLLVERPLRFVGDWVAVLWSVNAPASLLLLPGILALWRRRGRRDALPALALLVHPLGMALLAPYREPSFQEARYSIHLLPLAVAVATAALHPGGAGPAWGAPRRWPRALTGARARAGAAGLLLVAALAGLWPAAGRYGWAVQNIEAMQVALGRWVVQHTPAGARLALNDVGAIAYLSRRTVVDLMGLVTPAVLPYRRDGDAGVRRFLERACPDYLIIFPDWFPELAARAEDFPPIHHVHLAPNAVAGADRMVVYRTPWNRWQRDARPCRPDPL
jgi:hypothetical protein